MAGIVPAIFCVHKQNQKYFESAYIQNEPYSFRRTLIYRCTENGECRAHTP